MIFFELQICIQTAKFIIPDLNDCWTANREDYVVIRRNLQ